MAISKLKRWFLAKEPLRVDTFTGNRLDKKFGRVGIVALVNSNEEIKTIMSFYEETVSQNDEVSCILFSNKKDIEHEFFVKNTDTNWIGKPKGTKVESFLSKEYDQIWFATYDFNMQMEYILRNSRSHLKLGIFAKETYRYCHLFVNTPERKIETVINELKQIMLKINTNG